MLPKNANTPEAIAAMAADEELRQLKRALHSRLTEHRYTYNFTWFGRPIIQLPEDIVALQEILLAVQPDLVVETGVAHGGSLVLSASMLHLLGGDRLAVGVDIEIRPHNRKAIEAHPLASRMRLIEGSSVDAGIVAQVFALAKGRRKVMVMLDSNHTHDHVLKELELYSPLVGKDSYLIVYDTSIEDMPEGWQSGRGWAKDRNPKTAVREFLRVNHRFVVDREVENRLLQTTAPEGYLRCTRDA
jgi:cephalosporin hydroxylase